MNTNRPPEYESMSSYNLNEAVAPGSYKSHDVMKVVEIGTGVTYFSKKEPDAIIAQREIVSQTVIEAHRGREVSARTKLGREDADPNYYVLSEGKETFKSLWDVQKKLGLTEVARRINSGQYRGFGSVLVLALLTSERDMKYDNIGLIKTLEKDKHGNKIYQFVKIDGDWTSSRLREKEGNYERVGSKYNITASLIGQLPLLDTNAYMPYNWFDQVRGGKLVDDNFLNQIDPNAIRDEIKQELLRCILMPSACHETIAYNRAVSTDDAITQYMETLHSRMQMIKAACLNDDIHFNIFLKSDIAIAIKDKFIRDLVAFELPGGVKLDKPDAIDKAVNDRFKMIGDLAQIDYTNNRGDWLLKYKQFQDMKTGLNKFNETALSLAAQANDSDLIAITTTKTTINISNDDGYTPILYAARKNNTEAFQFLSLNGANQEIPDNDGYTTLTWAARNGNLDIVELAASKVDINGQTNTDKTALILAAREGHANVVNYLIDQQADMGKVDMDGKTALHHAVEKNRSTIVSKFVKSMSPDQLNMINSEGNTAIITAAKIGTVASLDIMGEIQTHPAVNLTHFNKEGRTVVSYLLQPELLSTVAEMLNNHDCLDMPITKNIANRLIHYAVVNGDIDVVERLIELGAKIDIKNNEGQSALMLAVKYDKIDIMTKLLEHDKTTNLSDSTRSYMLRDAVENNSEEAIQLLLENAAYASLAEIDLDMPLICAAKEGNTIILEMLLEKINPTPEQLNLALCSAAEFGQLDTVKQLVELGADVNHIDANSDNKSILMLAAMGGHENVVEYLMDHPDFNSLNETDRYGDTAFTLAAAFAHTDVIKMLATNDTLDILHKNDREQTGLFLLLTEQKDEVCTDLVLKFNYPNAIIDENNSTILHWLALDENNSKLMEMVIAKGGNLNAVNEDGNTPLHIAAEANADEIIQVLMRHGADAAKLNASSMSPLAIARAGRFISSVALLSNSNVATHEVGVKPPVSVSSTKDITKTILAAGKHEKSDESLNVSSQASSSQVSAGFSKQTSSSSPTPQAAESSVAANPKKSLLQQASAIFSHGESSEKSAQAGRGVKGDKIPSADKNNASATTSTSDNENVDLISSGSSVTRNNKR